MDWYYRDDIRPCGPFTFDELRALYRAGALGADTPVWHDGQTVGTTAAALLTDPVVPPRPRPTPGRDVPRAQDGRESLVGLGGWLTFYSIGYGVSVLWAGVSMLLVVLAGTGLASDFGYDWPVPLWAILVAQTANLCAAYLYFARSTAWPAVSTAASVVGTVVFWATSAGEYDAPPVWLLMGSVALHTAYVRSSARVRDTFVVPPARTLTEALERPSLPRASCVTLWVGAGLLALSAALFSPLLAAVGGAGYVAYRVYAARTTDQPHR